MIGALPGNGSGDRVAPLSLIHAPDTDVGGVKLGEPGESVSETTAVPPSKSGGGGGGD